MAGSGGHIVSGAATQDVTVDAAGCYELLVSSSNPLFPNCNARDTACVTVTVITPPSITCPAGVTQCPGSIPACPGSLAAFITAGGTASGAATPLVYNCSTASVVGTNCNGTITRTHSITDACNRTVSCTQIFTVKDTIPPVISCPGDRQIDCAASTNPTNTGIATATDNCSSTVTSTDVVSSQNCFTVISRTWKATDGCGNTATCLQHITITDRTAPVFVCQPTLNLACGSGIPTPGVSDNCSSGAQITTFFQDVFTAGAGGCASNSNRTRTWTAIDPSGNISTCVQQINFAGNRASNPNPGTEQKINSPADVQISAYPNPFNSKITIEFTSKVSTSTKLEVFDMNGSKVAELYKGLVDANKTYKVDFNGSSYSEGVYFYKLTSNDNSYMDRLILIK